MRTTLPFAALVTLSLAACATPDATPDATPADRPSPLDLSTPDAAPDAAPDVTPDAAPDVAPDAAPDVAPDVTLDAAPDVTLDAAPDVAPDVTLDAAPDVAPDVTLDAAPDVTLDVTLDAAPDVTLDTAPDAPRDAQVDVTADACVTPAPPDALATAIRAAWREARPSLEASVRASLTTGNGVALYNAQLDTANLLLYADHHRDVPLLDELAALYRLGFAGFVRRSTYNFYYAAGADGVERREQVLPITPARYWAEPAPVGFPVGHESVLNSSQFLYAVARVVGATASLPASQRTASLQSFVAEALPLALGDHYVRWVLGRAGEPGVFQVRGWGCNRGTYTHRDHVEHLVARRFGTSALPGAPAVAPSYCNAVTDTEMWIAAGVAELLAAHARAPALVPIDDAVRAPLTAYVRRAAALFAARTITTTLRLADGSAAQGRGFDHGAWDDHPDHRHTGYTGSTFPGWTDPANRVFAVAPMPARGVGWDISHARRWVTVMDTFRRRAPALGTAWPTRADLTGFARHFAFVVARTEAGRTRFTNFMDGTNGWYRVNYSDRPAFGYAPWGLSAQAAPSGYAFWATYEPASRAAVEAWIAQNPLATALDRVRALPSLAPFTSEPDVCAAP